MPYSLSVRFPLSCVGAYLPRFSASIDTTTFCRHTNYCEALPARSVHRCAGVDKGPWLCRCYEALGIQGSAACCLSCGATFRALADAAFLGLPATHGVSLTHRSLGATGARQDPGKVWKGKKMPGHMGHTLRYQRSLVVMKVDTRFDVLVVRGSIPGGKGSWVRIEVRFAKQASQTSKQHK